MNTQVHSITIEERDAAACVLANAFADDPVFRYILGSRWNNEQRLRHLFNESIATQLRKETHLVYRTDDGNAVALWHHIDDWQTPPIELVRSLPATIRAFGLSLPRAVRVLLSAEKVHPPEPHVHLAFIGTRDTHKGKGHGSALLVSMIERCDERGVSAYLESTNPANDAWYARFGFVSRGQVPLPNGAPVVTAMWRDPR